MNVAGHDLVTFTSRKKFHARINLDEIRLDPADVFRGRLTGIDYDYDEWGFLCLKISWAAKQGGRDMAYTALMDTRLMEAARSTSL